MRKLQEAFVFSLLCAVSNGLHNSLGSLVSLVPVSSSTLLKRQSVNQKINIPCEIVQHQKQNRKAWFVNSGPRHHRIQHLPTHMMRPAMKNSFYPGQTSSFMIGLHGRKKRFIQKPMCRVSPEKLPDYFNTKTIDEMLQKSINEIAAYMGSADICVGVMVDLDMCLTHRQTRLLHGNRNKRFKRKALKKLSKRWPNGNIPFEIIDGSFGRDDILVINDAMLEWEELTCLRFKQSVESDRDRLVIQTGAGCFSNVGRIGGPQPLVLGTGICRTKKVVMHEMAHAIGMIHEHQRPDRDNFIRVHLHNVKSRFVNQFDTFRTAAIENYNVAYDYLSIMHYGKTFFANDGISTTIQTLDYAYQDIIGRTEELSFSDVKTVNAMYKCSEGCPYPRLNCTADGYLNKHCKCVCTDGTSSCARLATAMHIARAPSQRTMLAAAPMANTRLDSYPFYYKGLAGMSNANDLRHILMKINQVYPRNRYFFPASQTAAFASAPPKKHLKSGQSLPKVSSSPMSDLVRKILLGQTVTPQNIQFGGSHGYFRQP